MTPSSIRRVAASVAAITIISLGAAACSTDTSTDTTSDTTEVESPATTVADWAASDHGTLTNDWATYATGGFDDLAEDAANYDMAGLQDTAADMLDEFETTYADVPDAFASAPDPELSTEGQAAYDGYVDSMESIIDGDLVAGTDQMNDATGHLNNASALLVP